MADRTPISVLEAAEAALKRREGNQTAAAADLGISRTTLQTRIYSLKLRREGKTTIYGSRATGCTQRAAKEAKPDYIEERELARVWNAVRMYPTNFDMERALGVSITTIRKRVDAYRHLRTESAPELPNLIWRRAATGNKIEMPDAARRQLDRFSIDPKVLKNSKGVVVTAAQFGSNVNMHVLATLKRYAAERGMPLVVMPIKYGPIFYNDHGELTATFPDDLVGHMVFEDTVLSKGELALNVARMRPTLSRFLSPKICEMGGSVSQIFAAPAMELEHVARIGRDYPKACMTTGSISIPNYGTDRLGQQDRTGEVAVANHDYGAIVVEYDKGKQFHFRQLVSNRKGEFYDIDPERGGATFYTPTSTEHRPNAVAGLVCGDWHTGKTDPVVREVTFSRQSSMAKRLHPDAICLHDFVDGDSISYYEMRQATRRGWKGPRQYDSLQAELDGCVRELEWIDGHTPFATKFIIASNHNEKVVDYIDTMRWTTDDANVAIGARLYAAMVDDLEKRNPKRVNAVATDPTVLWFRQHAPKRCIPLERTDTLLLPADIGTDRGILCSMHGDIGPKGNHSRSTGEFRKLNQRVVLGHNHSATIMGPVWRAGVSTPLTQFYVKNPSTNWTNTHCVIFDNGQRMLVNIINGRWHGRR